LKLASRFSAEGDDGFQVLWEDGDRVFCRGWRPGTDGNRSAVLAVLPAAEHPAPATLDRLTHEYGLKDELDGHGQHDRWSSSAKAVGLRWCSRIPVASRSTCC
jgi:hypothetical protein